MSGRSSERTIEVRIGKYEYQKLMQKAEENDTDLITILEWLVEEHLDEI